MSEPVISHRAIYRNVYHKRIDTRTTSPAEGIAQAELIDGELRFEGNERALAEALSEGIFFLRIPNWLNVAAGDECARTFHLGPAHPPHGALRTLGPETLDDPLLGFHERTNQIEQFLLERRLWEDHYSEEVAALGEDLTKISRCVIRSVLEQVRIPLHHWYRATGGCSEATGSYHFTFNHYRPTVDEVGLSSHKDDGFVTLLRATEPGLEINRHDRWESVIPDPNYLIVNFGLSMQLLTSRCSTPISAIMHRVTHQSSDRSTYGHFSSSHCTSSHDAGIYRWEPPDCLHRLCGSRELIDMNDYEIYEGTDESGE